MDLIIGPEILKSYKRLSYKVWYAFAEFIDNSTQAYLNNIALLEPVFQENSEFLTVKIDINDSDNTITVKDNSIGMNKNDLKKALTLGIPPQNTHGRSKYGLGLKTAAFWFGNTWTITTKQYGCSTRFEVRLNIDEIIDRIHAKAEQAERKRLAVQTEAEFNEDEIRILDVHEYEDEINHHGTTIKIEDLNQKITRNTKQKAKEYLRSIYRYDLQNDNLILYFDTERLNWSKSEFTKRLLRDDTGAPYYKEFSFDINGKEVNGWVGVLAKGSRNDAGFSLLQANRVIQGWPAGYKPKMLFGDQEGGINNLTNQRLIGELFLDDFNVSHTKDEILFEGDEEEKLDEMLYKKSVTLKRVAEAFRVNANNNESIIDFQPIVTEIFQNLQETKFRAIIKEYPVLNHTAIIKSNDEVFDRAVSEKLKDNYITTIAGITINILINDSASIYDPYLIVKVRAKPDSLGIVINRKHPHWQELDDSKLVFQFLKDCVLDGLAEWKAINMSDSLTPETIKFIKDHYLRETFILK